MCETCIWHILHVSDMWHTHSACVRHAWHTACAWQILHVLDMYLTNTACVRHVFDKYYMYMLGMYLTYCMSFVYAGCLSISVTHLGPVCIRPAPRPVDMCVIRLINVHVGLHPDDFRSSAASLCARNVSVSERPNESHCSEVDSGWIPKYAYK